MNHGTHDGASRKSSPKSASTATGGGNLIAWMRSRKGALMLVTAFAVVAWAKPMGLLLWARLRILTSIPKTAIADDPANTQAEEKPPVEKVDEIVRKVVEASTPQFNQLTLALEGLGTRLTKGDEKLTETALAVQGLCYQTDATDKRLADIDSAGHTAAIASAAAAKVSGIEPLTKEAWTEVVTEAMGKQAKGITKQDMVEAVTAGITPLAQAIAKPRTKRARKLEDGSVEITES